MKKLGFSLFVILVVAGVVFLTGPKASKPLLDPNPVSLDFPIDQLDDRIADRESGFKTLKPDNEAGIIWFMDSIVKTPYSVVFLHGFSASKMEGRPITTDFSSRYGMNLYEPRLAKHGLDTVDAMIDITAENYLESAKQAVAIGKLIGDSVILMCSSTGSTLGLYLAAHDPEIKAIFNYSPNIDLVDQTSHALTGPWGLELVRMMFGDDFREYEATEEFKKYWVNRYRLEALVMMRSLLDVTMTPETFNKITQPVFTGCYFKDEENQDWIVSVPSMRKMMDELGTKGQRKRMIEFANVDAHVITSPLRSQDIEAVRNETFRFAEEVLKLKPIAP